MIVPFNMACHCGEICFHRVNSFATVPAWKSFAKCSTPTGAEGKLNEVRQAAYGYLALTLDTLLNYNNRSGRWDNTTSRVRSIFDRHDFAFVWSYAEMAPLISGVGYDWAIDKTAKSIPRTCRTDSPRGG